MDKKVFKCGDEVLVRGTISIKNGSNYFVDMQGCSIWETEENILPFTVDSKPVRRGKWVEFGNDIHHCLECSKCGYLQSIYENRPKYCPNCGAKMEEECEDE